MLQPPEAAWPQIFKSWIRSRERNKDSALDKAGQILWGMMSRSLLSWHVSLSHIDLQGEILISLFGFHKPHTNTSFIPLSLHLIL